MRTIQSLVARVSLTAAFLALASASSAQTELERLQKGKEAWEAVRDKNAKELEEAQRDLQKAKDDADLDAKVEKMTDAAVDAAKDLPGVAKDATTGGTKGKADAAKSILEHAEAIYGAYGEAIDAIADSDANNARVSAAQQHVNSLTFNVNVASTTIQGLNANIARAQAKQSAAAAAAKGAAQSSLGSAQAAKDAQDKREANAKGAKDQKEPKDGPTMDPEFKGQGKEPKDPPEPKAPEPKAPEPKTPEPKDPKTPEPKDPDGPDIPGPK